MPQRIRVANVVIVTLIAGLVAYYVAIALGANHTQCKGNAISRVCATTPDSWAPVAAIVAAIIGGLIAFLIVRRDVASTAE